MAFRFPLETVQRLRQIAEDREERLLTEILRKIAVQHADLAVLATTHAQLLDDCETALHSKVSAAEILLLHGQLRAFEAREAALRKQLAHLEEQRQAQRKVYETAHRNRELLSHIREQQLELFKRAKARKEQMEMDDIFSCRRISS